MKSKEALAKMAIYVRHLAGKMPKGTKQAATNRLQQLAAAIEKQGNFYQAINTVYAGESQEYRFKVAKGLINGLQKKLAFVPMQGGQMQPPGGPQGGSQQQMQPPSMARSALRGAGAGALGGGAYGAATGSMLGLPGAAVGGAIGATGGAIAGGLSGAFSNFVNKPVAGGSAGGGMSGGMAGGKMAMGLGSMIPGGMGGPQMQPPGGGMGGMGMGGAKPQGQPPMPGKPIAPQTPAGPNPMLNDKGHAWTLADVSRPGGGLPPGPKMTPQLQQQMGTMLRSENLNMR